MCLQTHTQSGNTQQDMSLELSNTDILAGYDKDQKYLKSESCNIKATFWGQNYITQFVLLGNDGFQLKHNLVSITQFKQHLSDLGFNNAKNHLCFFPAFIITLKISNQHFQKLLTMITFLKTVHMLFVCAISRSGKILVQWT